MLRARNRLGTVFRLLAFAASVVLFAVVVSAADIERVTELVTAIGLVGLIVVLLPQIVALVAEAYGWKGALRMLEREVGLVPLLRVRIATEALSMSLPAGVLFGESAKPFMLSRHCGLSVNEGVAAIVARKYLLLLSQAFFVLAVATIGFEELKCASFELLGGPGLEWVALLSAVGLAATAAGVAAFLRQSAVARRVFSALRTVRSSPLSGWLDRTERRFSATDQSVSAFFAVGWSRHARPASWFVLGWLAESVETYAILRVLGADVGFVEIASIEILLTLVRHVVFVVPAGLGVQDLGYVTGLAALGVPDATSLGAAFVLVKRAKELLWTAFGYALLASEMKGEGLRAAEAVGTGSA